MLTTILATVVILGVLIFVHELGHLITAKLVDIEVPRFSIGFGPRIAGFRWGETEYVISALPLGGYVKMAGMEELEAVEGRDERADRTGLAAPTDLGLVSEEEPAGQRGRDFESKSIAARALVIASGVIMNFFLAFVLFAGMSYVWGVQHEPEARIASVETERLPAGAEPLAAVPPGSRVVQVGHQRIDDRGDLIRAILAASPGATTIRFADAPSVVVEVPADDSLRAELAAAIRIQTDPVLGMVVAGSPADLGGFEVGDRILSAAGQPVESWQTFQSIVMAHPGEPIEVRVQRGERVIALTVVPDAERGERDGVEVEFGVIGVASDLYERPGLLGAVAAGADRTWMWTAVTVGFVRDLFLGRVSPRNLGGPILIGQVSGRVARAGMQSFLNFMAILSINLAVLNLLPIPILDGGQLVFLLLEAVRGRALSVEQRIRLSQVGLVIVVAIMVFAFANDILRVFGL